MANLTFWGVTASPYQLKMQSLADYAQMPWQRRPEQGNMLAALGTAARLSLARKRQRVQRFPTRVRGMDEYPEVPYYTLNGRQFYYDSSGLALHLDSLNIPLQPLVPQHPALGFLCRLIDEAFDEFGLYMAHHNRWVTSADTNVMGVTTANEMRRLVPAWKRRRFAARLAERQVRRLPYLFSVAPDGYQKGPRPELTPPSREGFPATHALLDQAWRDYLAAMESLCAKQPYLLGQRFTLADASAYGQLSMNLVDGRAAQLLQDLAPRTFRWLCAIRDGEHRGSEGELGISAALAPLLQCIGTTFIPLMRQNESAYLEAVNRGETLFNEAAFDDCQALYNGKLMGTPFRAAIKSFQVVVWRDLCRQWQLLDRDNRRLLQGQFPELSDAAFAAPAS